MKRNKKNRRGEEKRRRGTEEAKRKLTFAAAEEKAPYLQQSDSQQFFRKRSRVIVFIKLINQTLLQKSTLLKGDTRGRTLLDLRFWRGFQE